MGLRALFGVVLELLNKKQINKDLLILKVISDYGFSIESNNYKTAIEITQYDILKKVTKYNISAAKDEELKLFAKNKYTRLKIKITTYTLTKTRTSNRCTS